MNFCTACGHWSKARENCDKSHVQANRVKPVDCDDYAELPEDEVRARSKISAILIVRDCAASLGPCLASIEPHVDQIVTVDTGSVDETPYICREFRTTFDVFTACNNADGLIEDFSAARNRSLELAEHDWILWIDSDDILHGGEHLRQLVEERSRITLGLRGLTEDPVATRYIMRYQYGPKVSQWRERLVGPRQAFQWQGPVHEGLFARPGVDWRDTLVDAIWVEHRAHLLPPESREAGRNLRILRAYCAKHGDGDPRMLCYLGSELTAVGKYGEAIRRLRRAVELETWPDQKAVGQLQLAEIYARIGDHETAIRWASDAMLTKSWPAPCYRLAKSFHSLASLGEMTAYNYHRCIRWARTGMAARAFNPPQMLIENQAEHGEIYNYLVTALYSVGYLDEAIQTCEEGLKVDPDDEDLKANLATFRKRDTQSKQLPRPPVTQPRAQGLAPGKLDVVIFTGQAWEQWDPDTIAKAGIGGSETMAWELAKRLAQRGHRVRLYGDPLEPYSGVVWRPDGSAVDDDYPDGGVKILSHRDFVGVECDVLISSRRPDAIDDEFGCRAHARILWVHDVVAPGLDIQRLARFDRVWCLSEWHREFLGRMIPPGARDKLVAIRNGIDVELIEDLEQPPGFRQHWTNDASDSLVRNPHRAIYSSSPDRGLECALDCWPAVRKQVPDAELHVFYGFELYERVNPQHAASLKAKMLATEGVVYHGRVPERELLRWMLTSGVWAYPTWEWAGPGAGETSCISAMQAQACGLWPVTSQIAALNETVFAGVRIEGDGLSPAYREQWVEACVKAMTSTKTREPVITEARRRFSLETLADELEQALVTLATRNRECVTAEFVEVEL